MKISETKNLGFMGLIIVVVLLVSSCVPLEEHYKNREFYKNQSHFNEKLNIIVSVLPQKAFVKAVGDDLVNVESLIPKGGSPATYEPKPSDLALVERADVYFRIGYIPFEKAHLKQILDLNPRLKVVDTSKGIHLRHFENGAIDPHIWLSPLEVKKQVDIIANTLSELDPAHAQLYKENAERFKQKLDELHKEIDSELKSLKRRKFMVFHPALGYFADEFGLEQVAIEREGKEPTPKELQQIIEIAKKEGIKVIFVQSQFNRNIAKSVAEETNGVVVSIDPLAEDYIENLRKIAKIIAQFLAK